MEQQKKHHQKHVVWDQQKLKQTEKYRGTFAKITEPKTPYRKNQNSDEEIDEQQPKNQQQLAIEESLYKAKQNSVTNKHKKIDIALLNAQLNQELSHYRQEKQEQSQMIEENQQEKRRRQEQFKKKRANHYNEFKMINLMNKQKWQQQDEN